MSIYLQAAEAVERELARVESLAQVAATLRQVGTLDQAVGEAEKRLASLNGDIADAVGTLATKRDQAAKMIEAANAQAHDIVSTAEASANDKLAAATSAHEAATDTHASAKTALAAAQDEARLIIANSEKRARELLAEAENKAETFQPAIMSAKAELNGWFAKITDAKGRHDEIVAAIAKLREKF